MGCKFGEKCSFAHRQVEGQPSQKPKKEGDKSAVAVLKDARRLGCVFQDTEPPVYRFYRRAQKSWDQPDECKSQKLRSVMQTSEKTKCPSLGKIQVKVPHQRSPYALKFEDMSQEETERQERCARGDAWRLAEKILKLKEKDKATFSHLPTNGVSQRHPQQLQGNQKQK